MHRAWYAIERGVCPAGLVLDHFRCHVRVCAEPTHVRPVTPEVNTPAIYGLEPRAELEDEWAIPF